MQIWDKTADFLLRLQGDEDRSPGLHVSEVIRSIALKTGKLDKKYGGDVEELGEQERFPPGDASTLRVMMGLAWEKWLGSAYPFIDFHAGELRRDGLIATPDGMSETVALGVGYVALHEFKVTWKSSRRGIESAWMWLTQCKCYCKMMGVRICLLHVYWVNGDYTYQGPQFTVHHIVFDQWEIDACWEMVMQEARTCFEDRRLATLANLPKRKGKRK
jgi:hypothetical protein